MPSVGAAGPQPGILDDIPPLARYLTFQRAPGTGGAREALETLAEPPSREAGVSRVVGLGGALVRELGGTVPGLGNLRPASGPGFSVPSTPAALWIWLRGDDRGDLVHETRRVARALDPAFRLDDVVDAFRYRGGLDLTGYEDGTENPTRTAARAAAVVSGAGPGLDGSSFVAAQVWEHDLDRFDRFAAPVQDHIIGRRRSDNAELPDGPDAAHVQRTEQEAFDPPTFLLRRSMPWADARRAGLVFVAFVRELAAFERHLDRMVGKDDQVVDHLFRFTRPLTGAFFWCPPVSEERLDLTALDPMGEASA